jgi:hypothetical protein
MIIKTWQLTSKFAPLILAVLVAGREARGDITITIEQSGSNVVATGSGTVATSGLTAYSQSPAGYDPLLVPNFATAIVGGVVGVDSTDAVYTGITGPATFGTGVGIHPDSVTGPSFGFYALGDQLALPSGYASGTQLISTATFDGTNLASLGLTAGTSYTYTIHGNGPDQYLTVQIVSTAEAVPEPSTAIVAVVGAVAFVTCGWFHHRRHQRRQVSA